MSHTTALPTARPSPAETKKVTVNLGFVDLGHIDLLVSEGFCSKRSDFIRTAVCNQLFAQSDAVRQVISRKSLVLGLQRFSRTDLESVQRAGNMLEIQVLGLATVDEDVPPELASTTISVVSVLGAFHASAAAKQALKGKIQ